MLRAQRQVRTAEWAAYAAAALYLFILAAFGLAPSSAASPIAGVTLHVVLLPVVAALPAAHWARAAGYGWLVLDMALDVATRSGLDDATNSALRLGGQALAALWIVSASLRMPAAKEALGLVLASLFLGYSFVAPWVPVVAFMPALLLLLAWLVAVGRSSRTSAARMPASR